MATEGQPPPSRPTRYPRPGDLDMELLELYDVIERKLKALPSALQLNWRSLTVTRIKDGFSCSVTL